MSRSTLLNVWPIKALSVHTYSVTYLGWHQMYFCPLFGRRAPCSHIYRFPCFEQVQASWYFHHRVYGVVGDRKHRPPYACECVEGRSVFSVPERRVYLTHRWGWRTFGEVVIVWYVPFKSKVPPPEYSVQCCWDITMYGVRSIPYSALGHESD